MILQELLAIFGQGYKNIVLSENGQHLPEE
jgi:hypothetical protein